MREQLIIRESFVSETDAEEAVSTILRFVGENPSRDGLLDTPGRVVRAWREMTAGYREDPSEILGTTFEEDCDEMVVLTGVSFYSTCEHHLLPFYGTASIGYLPGKVVGISKIARVVNCFARRLQIQERLTREVADAIETHLDAKGVAVVIRAHHLCMGCRGVKQPGTDMITSAMRGVLRNDANARSEFLRLIHAD
ncbi:MAG TPA: GTP cyclohydrolase I FolE [Thermoanaerobaculia bacterium]|nr:GTP cyclohydrolase I FolE [Thermoanaerobaculia bacterium]